MTVRPDTRAEWWTTAEVAEYLGVRPATVSAYRNRDQMPEPDNKLGRAQLWRPSTIIGWAKNRPGRGNWG
ncbi:AlpA family transcriptional regulator [Labedaea rhizosphaerae]|uniref:AlpA family transcriptional regulator n=1 Tax=Labedaea rhizosphaerae TaxID=598644 RepID=A0A4R6SLU4_LABRH|nr:AlpA family transcriptional regulator [Labedaea rhizosphaerae]